MRSAAISEILTDPNAAIAGSTYTDLAACYKQLNASVGEFGTNTLIADTAALNSGGGGDGLFKSTQKKLSKLLLSGTRSRPSSRTACSMRRSTTSGCRVPEASWVNAGRCSIGPRSSRPADRRRRRRRGTR